MVVTVDGPIAEAGKSEAIRRSSRPVQGLGRRWCGQFVASVPEFGEEPGRVVARVVTVTDAVEQ
jgi:hypothetical protein